MALFKFRVSWDDDEQVYRDIVLKSGQTFDVFKTVILDAFEFKIKDKSASFFESNERWLKGREISSEVLVNKKNAPALSMLKTPVSALVNQPEKRFLFHYDPEKNWVFLITLILLEKEEDESLEYPLITKAEGVSPASEAIDALAFDKDLEIEDRFDLSSEDMDEEGFSEENFDF